MARSAWSPLKPRFVSNPGVAMDQVFSTLHVEARDGPPVVTFSLDRTGARRQEVLLYGPPASPEVGPNIVSQVAAHE